MYKVLFTNKSINYLWNYFSKYREYYQNLYEDSWLWSEKHIIESYINEAKNRKIEILDVIEKTLKEENILWRKEHNSIIIKWRTKYLFIDFSEDQNLKERFVYSVSIR